MAAIAVALPSTPYKILVQRGIASHLSEVLEGFSGRTFALVSSRRVFALHGRRLRTALGSLGKVHTLLMGDGERFKTRKTLDRLHDAMVRAGVGRDGVVVALGGGVVGDVAGFAAATYMRGIDVVQIPTTLLAMVDSSIGGKVGINHPLAKNLIGAFHQPKAVVVDPLFLGTLPPRQLRSGAFEVLKCGILGGPNLFAAIAAAPLGLQDWGDDELDGAIVGACRIKAEIVQKDEREAGLRRVLNLGHTLGHALEAATAFGRYTHGEAVGWGLVGASSIAHSRGLLKGAAFDAIVSAVERLGPLPRVSDVPRGRIREALERDKKKKEGRISFILPRAIGRVTIVRDVGPDEIGGALSAMAELESRPRRGAAKGRLSGRGAGSRPRRRPPTGDRP